jgi:hypothetical protein
MSFMSLTLPRSRVEMTTVTDGIRSPLRRSLLLSHPADSKRDCRDWYGCAWSAGAEPPIRGLTTGVRMHERRGSFIGRVARALTEVLRTEIGERPAVGIEA